MRPTPRTRHLGHHRSPPTRTRTTTRRRAVTQQALQPAAASHSLPARAPTAPHVAQHTTHAASCAPSASRADRSATYTPSAHHTRTHAATTPREPRCSGLPGPPPPHTRFRLARPSHRTVRSTQRTQHFARHASRAAHCALPLATSHPRNHTAPTRRDAAGSSARRRLALAFGPRADRAAPCATRGARSTLRATLRTQHSARFAPHTRTRPHRDRTARCAAHITHATRCAPSDSPPTAPLHCAPSAHHSRTRTATSAPTRRDAVGPNPPSPRIRFRIARRSHRAARSPPRTQHMACLPHTHAHPALAKRHIPALAKRHAATSAPTRRDTAGPSARRRLALTPGSRANRAARRAARQRATRCAPFASQPTAPQHCAPSAHPTRTHTAGTLRQPRRSELPSPPPPRIRFELALRPHRTVRSTSARTLCAPRSRTAP